MSIEEVLLVDTNYKASCNFFTEAGTGRLRQVFKGRI